MIDQVLDTIVEYGNFVEGLLWIGIGLGFMILSIRGAHWRVKLTAAVAFAAFGISDFVEMRTGAWWRPWWLLVWKAACIFVLLALLLAHIRTKRAETTEHP